LEREVTPSQTSLLLCDAIIK
jgi:hypothetical protein